MDPVAASALRRGALLSLAGGATLAAHIAAAGPHGFTAAAPLLWAGLLSLAVIAGHPRRGYRARGPAGTLASVAVVQALAHLVLHGAPWALGVVPHHTPDLATPDALTAHAVAALVVTLLMLGVDGLLALACAVRRVVRAMLGAAPARGGVRTRAPAAARRPSSSRHVLVAAPRGPPALPA